MRGPDHLGRFEADATVHWHQRDTQISKDMVMEMARERSAIIVRADVQGLGKGVFDAIRREVADLGRPLTVDEYRAADPAQDPERFLNRKAEDAWSMRLVMERDGLRLNAREVGALVTVKKTGVQHRASLDHSYLRASIGFSAAAFRAG